MPTAEGTKDSIFRIPQRMKNALGIFIAVFSIAGCVPEPTQPPIGAIDMPGSPTPTHIEIIPPTFTPTETPVAPTATETPNSHSETSRYFEPGFQLDVEGNVDGIKVPFTVGLHPSIMDRAVEPVTSVTVNRPDATDVYAKFWLTMCWKKYEMQHPEASGITFAQYEQLVKAGGGEIQIAAVDEKTDDQNNKLLTFHPENGFVFIPVDDTVHLPEALNTISGIYFGMNEKGQLVIVKNDLGPGEITEKKTATDLLYGIEFELGAFLSTRIAESMELILTLDNDGLLSSTTYWQKVGQGYLPNMQLYLVPMIFNPMGADKTPFFIIGQ